MLPNRKLTDLTLINKFLIVIHNTVLFSRNFNIQSSGFGMTSCFHSVLKYCGIYQFSFAVLRYLPNFLAVLRCSEPPDVPLCTHAVKSFLGPWFFMYVVDSVITQARPRD